MIKKVFISVILVFAGINICQAEMIMPSQSIENEVLEVERPSQAYNMMSRIKKDRNTIYNVLNLTPDQICKMTEIEQERYKEIIPVVECLMQKKSEIKQLKEEGASKSKISAAEREADKLESKVKKIGNKYDKQFEKILNKEQKSKYKMIQKLRYEDLKKLKKIDKYGRKESDLRPFGCKISQPAYLEQLNEQRSFKNKCRSFFKKN